MACSGWWASVDNRDGLAFVLRSLASGAGLLAVGQWVVTNEIGWAWAGLTIGLLVVARSLGRR